MKKITFKQVTYKNFKSAIKQNDFVFETNGLHLITGKNGIGKTTIFHAIAACLFRKVKTKDGNLKITELVNESTGKDLELNVLLEINNNGKIDKWDIYTFYNHRINGNQTLIYINDSSDYIKLKSVDETINYIETNIISYDVFYNILGLPQQVKDTFASMTDANQKKLFDMIIDLDFYDVLKDIVKINYDTEANSIKSTTQNIESIEKLIQMNNYNIQETQNQYQQKYLALNDTKLNIDNKLKEINVEDAKTKLNNVQLEINNIEIKKNMIYTTIDKYNSDIKNIQNLTIAKLDEIKKDEQLESVHLLQQQNELNAQLQTDTNDFNNQIKLLESQKQNKLLEMQNKIQNDNIIFINNLSEKINENKQLINNINLNYNNNKNNIEKQYYEIINNIKFEINNLQININNFQQEINKLNNINLINSGDMVLCPNCKKPFTENDQQAISDHINKLTEVIKDSTTNINILNQKQSGIQFELSEKLVEIKSTFDNDVEKINTIIHQFNLEITDVKIKEQQIINNEVNNITQQYNNIIEELKNKKNNNELYIKQKNQNIIEQLNGIRLKFQQKASEANYNSNNEMYLYQQKIDDLNMQINNNQMLIQNLKNTCINEQQIVNTYDQYCVQYKNIENDIETLNKVTNKTIENYNNHTKQLCIEINNKKNEIEHVQRKTDIIKFWYDSLQYSTGIKTYLIASIIPELNTHIQNILSKNQNINFSVNIETNTENTKFKLNIINNATGSSGYNKLSGGEQRLIDFTCLLALNKLYRQTSNIDINIMLFDELFDSLDLDNSLLTLEMLKELSADLNINIISHSDIFRNNDLFDCVFDLTGDIK